VTLDALQGVAYHNDRQVRRIAADYADEPVAGGGLAVEVGELEMEQTDAAGEGWDFIGQEGWDV
ncbi:TPA: RusA family crossover junction endodeoxyribonuclease, partial [Neisseria gonorrhoeae]